MSYKTHELYDENEYFIKFLAIHPCLYYPYNKLMEKKLEFQIYLLDNLKNNTMTNDEIINIYNNTLEIEIKHNNLLEAIKEKNKIIELELKKNNDENIISLYNLIMKNK